VAYKFKIGNNKRELLTDFESVTQKVLLPVEPNSRTIRSQCGSEPSCWNTTCQIKLFDLHFHIPKAVFILLFLV
jgi:hypothetical protein